MKIGFVVPYFGQLPNYFPLFLKSCRDNPDYEWLIFTDSDIHIDFPDNVHKIDMTFEALRELFQGKFDFKISLDKPYKLCDYKPAYGFLFEDYLKEYDYWGYCDIDTIIGNLKCFFPENKLLQYDKIGHLGHMSLYKNVVEVNTMFMKPINGKEVYKEIFCTNRIYVFDEWGESNINMIFNLYGRSVWYWNEFCDIYPYDDGFKAVNSVITTDGGLMCKHIVEKGQVLVLWEFGRIYRLENKRNMIQKNECAYVHFQKRNMHIKIDNIEERILCRPDSFEQYDETIVVKELNRIRLVNRKRLKHVYDKTKYSLIEKTGPIRHAFRRRTSI